MSDKYYCVYILTNKIHTVLYTGVTNNLIRRLEEHKHADERDFAARYKAFKLVYYECGSDISLAIMREKQIKKGSRAKKIALINTLNPEWRDLAEDFYP